MAGFIWRLADLREIDSDLMGSAYGDQLIANLLIRRGISSAAQAEEYLFPEKFLSSPGEEFPDLSKAIRRIETALQNHDKICIWGDFDVDGQTSTALLFESLKIIGGVVVYHIPDRVKDSHGLHIPGLQSEISSGCKLIITCDTGISAKDAVDFANTSGIDVIITDHHEPPESLPLAFAIINPHLLSPKHKLSSLPGVGVAYKLIESLYKHLNVEYDSSNFLDLVAIGIISDLAILQGETRYLAQKGIEILRNTGRVGLLTMFELAGINPAGINEETIGFSIGPRLNSIGRLSDANLAVEFLTTSDKVKAQTFGLTLENLNIERQALTKNVYLSAKNQLNTNPEYLKESAIVLAHQAWPAGIIGIVANQLAGEYQKPVILFSLSENEPARGSARSFGELNIINAITRQKDLLVGFGGHKMAAGLTIEEEKIPQFRKKISQTVKECLENTTNKPELAIDAVIQLEDIQLNFATKLESLAPFGAGNPKIILATNGLKIIRKRKIGKKKEHLIITVADSKNIHKDVLIWFSDGMELPEGEFDLAYTIRTNTFQGKQELQLEFIDWRIPDNSSITEISSNHYEWVDLRKEEFPFRSLDNIMQEYEDVIIWGEGINSQHLKVTTRLDLKSSKNLVIWSPPPDLTTLKEGINAVNPNKIIVFGNDSEMDQFDKFIPRLLGLLKYLKNNNTKKVSIERIAAACAQNKRIILLALDYLASSGTLGYQIEEKDQVLFNFEHMNPSDQKIYHETRLKKGFKETEAFRSFFRKCDLSKILD